MEYLLKKLKIIYEDNHIIVALKPINMPTCEDNSKDVDFLSLLKFYLKQKYNKPGNVYLGLLHRLDRPVGGIMVFAKTSKAASRLSEQIRANKMVKKYYCVIEGCPNEKEGILKDSLLKDPKTNKVIVSEKGKYAELAYKVLKNKENLSLLEVDLYTGRSHQIRVQFSSRNMPLFGDQKYNKKAIVHQQIALFSFLLSFKHPITKELMTFSLEKPDCYPFNLF